MIVVLRTTGTTVSTRLTIYRCKVREFYVIVDFLRTSQELNLELLAKIARRFDNLIGVVHNVVDDLAVEFNTRRRLRDYIVTV